MKLIKLLLFLITLTNKCYSVENINNARLRYESWALAGRRLINTVIKVSNKSVVIKNGSDPRISKQDLDKIEELLRNPIVDINYTNEKGETALMIASMQYGCEQIVELLLKYNANVNKVDNEYHTALEHAILNSCLPAIMVLLGHNAYFDESWYRVLNVRANPRVNCQDYYCSRCQKALIFYTYKYEYLPYITNFKNKNEFHVQVGYNNYKKGLKFSKFYEIKIKNRKFFEAAYCGNLNALRELFKDPLVNINTRNEYGKTALMLTRDNSIVEFLLENGADVNIQDKYGITVLMENVAGGCLKIVETLLENRPDLNIKDNLGKTAIDYANKFNQKELAELLNIYAKEYLPTLNLEYQLSASIKIPVLTNIVLDYCRGDFQGFVTFSEFLKKRINKNKAMKVQSKYQDESCKLCLIQ